jgi:hypothetical protein
LENEMSDMVERVGRAILSAMRETGLVSIQANGPNGEMGLKQFSEVMAMDAIEAMREPTPTMLVAEGVQTKCHMCGGHKEGWQLMIDAALRQTTSSIA